MDFGNIPEFRAATVLDISRRRDYAAEVRAETSRRRSRTTLWSRVTTWIDRHRHTITPAKEPGRRVPSRPRITTHY